MIHQTRNSTTELTLFAGNGCKFLSLYSANIVGSLNLTSKSKLKYLELTSCNVNNVLLSVGISESAIFETLLASCYCLEKISLASLSITPNMITGIILHWTSWKHSMLKEQVCFFTYHPSFAHWCNGEVSKRAGIWLTKLIFYKNHPKMNFFWRLRNKEHIFCYWHFLITSIFNPIHFLKRYTIFDSSPLLQFSKFKNFIWLQLMFSQKPF